MRLALGIAALLSTSLLAACSADGPTASDAATALATGFTRGDLTGLPLTTKPGVDLQKEYDAARGDLEKPQVSVGSVSETDDTAIAVLRWEWDVAGHPWTYDAQVPLTKTGDTWQAAWSPGLVEPHVGDEGPLEVERLAPKRGEILGAGGAKLVTPRAVLVFGLDKTRVKPAQQQASATRLARLVGIDPARFAKAVKAAGPRGYVKAITLRKEEGDPLLARASAIAGAAATPDRVPLAPARDWAAPILGTVGDATAEIVKESQGAVVAGDVVGLSGLQKRYDEQLRGTPGVVVTAGDRTLFRVEPADGKPLRTTLDESLQTSAEAALAAVGPASAIVALRPSTGDVLAAASGPGSKGYNTATFGQYAPGSTFKVVSALALLRAGTTATTPVPCTSTLVVDGKRFKNYDDYPASGLGRIPLESAFANSCNTAFISQRDSVDDLASAAAALGLGVDHDLGFPAYFGQVPPPATETERAADLIGQGKVLASPLSMAAVAGSVAAGHAVLPRLLPDHDVTATTPATPLTKAEAATLRTLMRAVVTRGSGRGLADVPGEVMAKTGTAEFGPGADPDTHAWMIAIRGDLAVAVFVERGESGSKTAGPVLERFLRAAG